MNADNPPDADCDGDGSFWEAFRVPPPKYLAEDLAPTVDEEFLRRLVRREVPDEIARGLYELIDSFRSWHDAYLKISVEEYHRWKQTQGSQNSSLPKS